MSLLGVSLLIMFDVNVVRQMYYTYGYICWVNDCNTDFVLHYHGDHVASRKRELDLAGTCTAARSTRLSSPSSTRTRRARSRREDST